MEGQGSEREVPNIEAVGDILDKVRASARWVKSQATKVHINEGAITSFLQTLAPAEFAEKTEVVGYPLRFPALEDEVNFWALLSLLNIGSGFRPLLRAVRRPGAFETIQRGVVGMYISAKKLDSAYLASISLEEVGSLFDLPLFEEKDVHQGIMFMQVPSPLHPLGDHIRQILNETGRILLERGIEGGLGQWVVNQLRSKEGRPDSAAQLVEALAATFPAFNDVHMYKGDKVYILKKAQLLVGDLYRHMRNKDPKFNFADINRLTVFSDNVLPTVLRKLGILTLDSDLASQIDGQQELEAGEAEVELRALAIEACEEIIQAWRAHTEKARSAETQPKELIALPAAPSVELDYFLWKKGKDDAFRSVERHYTRNTHFY
jgi:hypothetical protein